MAKRRHQVDVASRSGNADDLADDLIGVADMLQNGIALDALKSVVRERQLPGIRGHIDAGDRQKIEVDVAGHGAAGAAYIEIPAAQGEIARLVGVQDVRGWWGKKAQETVAPAAGGSPAIERFEIGWGGGVHRFQYGEGKGVYIEIPAAQGEIARLVGVQDVRGWWGKKAQETVAP